MPTTKPVPFSKRLRPEDVLHANVCKYILFKYRGAVIHHSPNEGRRTPFERYMLKVLHVSSGWPDLIVVYKRRIIAIELKEGKNKMTANQEGWLFLLGQFMPAKCCTGFDQATKFIDEQFMHL
jgi:hypothetical protein